MKMQIRECDDSQGASKRNLVNMELLQIMTLSTTLTKGQKLSIKVEMKAFSNQSIFL